MFVHHMPRFDTTTVLKVQEDNRSILDMNVLLESAGTRTYSKFH